MRLQDRVDVSGKLSSPAPQIVAIVIALLFSSAIHWENDGLWFQGDSPRHAATGLFFADLLEALPSRPLDYALSYYARYPIIVPMAYPPLFYVLEAVAFEALTPTSHVAKGLVLLFAGLCGLYTMYWGRRSIAPIAGWAGAVVILTPMMVRYSNAVMLNVPATALALGALFHLQEWSSSASPRHRILFILLSLGAVLTYYPSAIVIPIALAWLTWSKRDRMRSATPWATLAVLLILIAFLAYAFPLFSLRNAPRLTRMFSSQSWLFYLKRLPLLASYPWLVLGLVGVAWGWTMPKHRSHATKLALAYPVGLGCLVLLPALSERYALLLTPITILAAFLAIALALQRVEHSRTAFAGAALVVVFGWTGWTALRTEVPEVAGFGPIAEFIRTQGPHDNVLYSGRYDGVFGFYLQASDRQFDRRLVLTSRLLYRYEQNIGFTFIETPHVSSPSDVVELIRQQSGCRWIAVEVGAESTLPRSDRYLREALSGAEFEKVASFPVSAALVTHVDLYRVTIPIQEAPVIDLQFPSFSPRVFRNIAPVTR